jgi:hypothetical protein
MQLTPGPNPLHFIRAAPVAAVRWFGLPTFLTRCLAGLPAFNFQTELLVMVVPGIGDEAFFTAKASAAASFEAHLIYILQCRCSSLLLSAGWVDDRRESEDVKLLLRPFEAADMYCYSFSP